MDSKIATINVRGLRDRTKRRIVFNFLRDEKIDIAFLQETHSLESDYRYWRSEWGSEILLAHGTERRCGVALFFRRNFSFSILRQHVDPEGRFVYAHVSHAGKFFHLINVYAPVESVIDRVRFFERLSEQVLRPFVLDDLSPVFLGGDFNTYVSRLAKSTYDDNPDSFELLQCARDLLDLQVEFNLEDCWQSHRNDLDRGYTRFQTNPEVSSRIDLFLTSVAVRDNIESVQIKATVFSDHCALSFVWRPPAESMSTKSPYWKFNSTLLDDVVYVDEVKRAIATFKHDNANLADPVLKWDLLLVHLRGLTISYSTHKKRMQENANKALLDEISFLSKALFESPDQYLNRTAALHRLTQCRSQILEREEARAKAAMVRARLRWAEQGEKSTRYFFQLEKKRFKEIVLDRVESEGRLRSS